MVTWISARHAPTDPQSITAPDCGALLACTPRAAASALTSHVEIYLHFSQWYDGPLVRCMSAILPFRIGPVNDQTKVTLSGTLATPSIAFRLYSIIVRAGEAIQSTLPTTSRASSISSSFSHLDSLVRIRIFTHPPSIPRILFVLRIQSLAFITVFLHIPPGSRLIILPAVPPLPFYSSNFL